MPTWPRPGACSSRRQPEMPAQERLRATLSFHHPTPPHRARENVGPDHPDFSRAPPVTLRGRRERRKLLPAQCGSVAVGRGMNCGPHLRPQKLGQYLAVCACGDDCYWPNGGAAPRLHLARLRRWGVRPPQKIWEGPARFLRGRVPAPFGFYDDRDRGRGSHGVLLHGG